VTNVASREVDGVSVVTPYGRIVFGEQSNAVREKVKNLISKGKKQIVLDMKNILVLHYIYKNQNLHTLIA